MNQTLPKILALIVSLLGFLYADIGLAQNCDPDVPEFEVDLSANPDTTWLVPDVQRNGTCCDARRNAPCVSFIITLHPDAVGINFGVCEGAEPSGSLYYQIDCGVRTPVGEPICLNNAGPHQLTFCKPGANQNTFCITSIPAPEAGPDVTVQEGCAVGLTSSGFDESNITWESIQPGARGDFDYLLSCNDCANPEVDVQGVNPDTIFYEVRGFAEGECGSDVGIFRDTVRVIITPGPTVTITSDNEIRCSENDEVTLTATVTGGTPPYQYNWSNGQTSASVTVVSGDYTVSVTDALGCEMVQANFSVPPINPIVLNTSTTSVNCVQGSDGSATVTISGGTPPYQIQWNDPAGQQNATATGLSSGTYEVTVTDSLGCEALATVTVQEPANPLAVTIVSQSNVQCFGEFTGSITVNASGGTAPYTYSWSHDPELDNPSVDQLRAGTYVVTVTDANGCEVSLSIEITQPQFALAADGTAQPVACFGENTGSITGRASGGTTPYQYRLDGGPYQTAENFANLGAGTYTLVVRDANGCIDSIAITITQPNEAIAASTTATAVTCSGGNNGSASVTASGGTPPYSYQWNDPSSQQGSTASGLAAGTYVVTITDANGCTHQVSATIDSPVPLTATTTAVDNVCSGGNAGSATVNASGGTPPYRYQWNDSRSQTNATATQLASGNYQVTVTDANGCTLTVTVMVDEPSNPLQIQVTAVNPVSCSGGNDGSATVAISGGTPGYTISWNDPSNQTSTTANNLAAGTYTVTVTDANGCTTARNVTISEPTAPVTASLVDRENISCANASDGFISVEGNGGTAPYTYQWNDPSNQTTPTAVGLGPGTYTVTITDANGCTTTLSETLTAPAPLSLAISDIEHVACFGEASGYAQGSATGGTPPYQYQWNDALNQQGNEAFNLRAGTYTLTVTDANGCTQQETVTITEPNQPLNATISSQSNVSCKGASDGSAGVLGSGGTPPYRYLWSDANSQTSSTATGLAAGVYQVTVTDANGCSVTRNVNIGEPANPLNIAVQKTQDVQCFGGSDGAGMATGTGGTTPYDIFWSPSGINGAEATGLAAGIHRATIIDDNGCTAFGEIEITAPQEALAVAITDIIDVGCFGQSSGTLIAAATGGTAPYSYQWNDPGLQSGDRAGGLAAGTYTVTVTDANGCSIATSATVNQPAQPLSASTVVNAATCNNSATGSAIAQPSGGTPPYQFLWDDPNAQRTAQASNLRAGTYTVQITDFNGCQTTATATVTEPNSPLSVQITANPVDCNGGSNGSATAVVSGGTSPYNYQWNDPAQQTTATAANLTAGEYSVTVTDANGCVLGTSISISQPNNMVLDITFSEIVCAGANNGMVSVSVTGGTPPYSYFWDDQSGTTSNTATGLPPGNYRVTVTDANGCTQQGSVNITQEVRLNLNLAANDPNCFGSNDGSIVSTVDGGTTPYTYSWNPGGATSRNLINIGGGTYTLSVTDGEGCPISATATLEEPTAITLAGTATDALCFGTATGIAQITASGGTPPYSYLWNDAAEQTAATATGLPANNYQVVVTDAAGCTEVENLTIGEPTAIAITLNATDNDCFGEQNGSIAANVGGGTPGYTYQWNDANNQSSATATGLGNGNYTLRITDSQGCVALASEQVAGPAEPLRAQINGSNVACKGSASGSATVSVNGGTPGYSYQWNDPNSQTTPTATGLVANNYEVTITDQNGCGLSKSIAIIEPSTPLTLNTTSEPVACKGGSTGTATALVSGGVAPYTYQWNDSLAQNTAQAVALKRGIYNVTITDAAGCVIVGSVFVQESSSQLTGTVSADEVQCFGDQNGSAQVTINGGIAPYFYQWNDAQGQTTPQAIDLKPGQYQITVTDDVGCTYTDSVIVAGPTQQIVHSFNRNAVSCFGLSDGSITVAATGGNGGFTHQWNDPNLTTGTVVTNLSAGYYTVTTTDAKGCTKSDSTFLRQPRPIALNLNTTPVFCKGLATGSIFINPSGGTAPYNYGLDGNTPNTNNKKENLAAGNYNIVVVDANGCQTDSVVAITEPDDDLTLIGNTKPVDCFGNNNGKAWLEILHGNPPFQIAWDDSLQQLGDTAFTLPSGRYKAIVTDNKGCEDSIAVTVAGPATPLDVATSATPAICFNDPSGSAAAAPSGGTAPYTYVWNDPARQKDAIATDLIQGQYLVSVIDANGCTEVRPITVPGPSSPLRSAIATYSVACFGGNSGAAQLNIQGGTAPYSYQWNTPGGSVTDSVGNLPVGSYNVTITDANNCTITQPFTIAGPDAAMQLAMSATEEQCFDDNNGTATVTVQGGQAPYTYAWNDPEAQQTRKAIDLAPGIYEVLVTDALGCVRAEEISVLGPENPLQAVLNARDTRCFGFADGSVEAAANGGTPPYEYRWNIPNAGTNANVSGLSSGQYTIDITDAQGCRYRDTITVNQPTPLRLNLNVQDLSCYASNDGSLEAEATGGSPNYTFDLDNGNIGSTGIYENLGPGSHQITVSDVNNCENSRFFFIDEPDRIEVDTIKQNVLCNGQANGGVFVKVLRGGTVPYQISWDGNAFEDTAAYKAAGLAPGTYRFIVRDAANCTAEGIMDITEPPAIDVNVSGPQTICAGTPVNIGVTANGGTGNLIPSWNYNLPSQYTHTVSPDRTSVYRVTLKDENDCFSDKGEIPIYVRNSEREFVRIHTVDTICSGNTIEVSASHTETAGPYQYNWGPSGVGFGNSLGPFNYEADSTILLTLDIINSACNDTISDDRLLTVTGTPKIFLPDTIIQGCVPQEILLVDTVNQNSGILEYDWILGDGTTSTSNPLRHTYENKGEYDVFLTITSPYGCETTSEAAHKVLVYPSPFAMASADKFEVDVRNARVQFFNESEDYTDWIWDFMDGSQSTESNPIKTFADTGLYDVTLEVFNQFGCSSSTSLRIQVNPFISFEVPNGFTPNTGGGNGGYYDEDDLSNDIFYPITDYVDQFNMKIFNRWGELIFESNDIKRGWDGYYRGQLSQQDVYVWKINVSFVTGESLEQSGNVTLIWKE